MMSAKQIEAMARVLASYELFDWDSLPEQDVSGWRDRKAFRAIVENMIIAMHSGGQ